MASLTKQQKRAKRAKVKAKQQRLGRNTHQPTPYGDGSDAYTRERIEILFTHFQRAESESRKALFLTLFTTLVDVVSATPELQQTLSASPDPSETMVILSQSFMVDYREWAYGATEEETFEWLASPEVLEDFTLAMDEVVAELEAGLSEEDE